jgi:hypothetical protein
MGVSHGGFRRTFIAAAALAGAGLGSCIPYRSATDSPQDMWEVANRSQCYATVDLRTRHGRIMGLGTVPPGATQTYLVAPRPGAFVSALSLEEDGMTGCAGGDHAQRLVKIRKLSEAGD